MAGSKTLGMFRKLPVTIEAVRLDKQHEIETLEGTMIGEPGDWLITGVAGEQYPCKDNIFRATYEPVDSVARTQWNSLPARGCAT